MLNTSAAPVIRCMPADSGCVYLSFDDGPDAEWTPRILDVLAQADLRATFFIVACRARAAPQLMRRALADGHAIGNHSYSHRHPWRLSTSAARREVLDGAAAIADLTGQMPKLFRPPHGRVHPAMRQAAAESGQAIVLWNRSAIDWGPLGTAARIATRLARVQGGDIVLMHDARSRRNKPMELLDVLPDFLRDLIRRQLRCAPLAGEHRTN